MVEKAVTVGDTEVTITETDDGFEVEAVEDEPEGLYLRCGSLFGCEVPLDGNFEIGDDHGNWRNIAFDTSEDISNMSSDGKSNDLGDESCDGEASVKQDSFEIVEY